MTQHDTHVIYVPRNAAANFISPGSAIVASLEESEKPKKIVFYEGNLYGFDNIKNFGDKALHAADRQTQSYPTSAVAHLDAADLIEVGRYSHTLQRVTSISDPEALRQWAPGEAGWIEGFIPW